jgi:hypothetical protein
MDFLAHGTLKRVLHSEMSPRKLLHFLVAVVFTMSLPSAAAPVGSSPETCPEHLRLLCWRRPFATLAYEQVPRINVSRARVFSLTSQKARALQTQHEEWLAKFCTRQCPSEAPMLALTQTPHDQLKIPTVPVPVITTTSQTWKHWLRAGVLVSFVTAVVGYWRGVRTSHV